MSMHMDMRSRYRTGSHEPSPLGRHARPGPTSSGQYFRSNSYTSTYPPTPLTPPDMYRQEAGDNALPCYPGSQYPGSTGTTSSSQFSGPTYSTAGGMTPQSAGFPPMGGPGFPPGPPGPPGSGPFH